MFNHKIVFIVNCIAGSGLGTCLVWVRFFPQKVKGPPMGLNSKNFLNFFWSNYIPIDASRRLQHESVISFT